jgi:hypothetical protein
VSLVSELDKVHYRARHVRYSILKAVRNKSTLRIDLQWHLKSPLQTKGGSSIQIANESHTSNRTLKFQFESLN